MDHSQSEEEMEAEFKHSKRLDLLLTDEEIEQRKATLQSELKGDINLMVENNAMRFQLEVMLEMIKTAKMVTPGSHTWAGKVSDLLRTTAKEENK